MATNKRVYSFTGLTDPPPMLMNLSTKFQAGTGSNSLVGCCGGTLSPPDTTSDAYTDVRCNFTPQQRSRRLWKPVLPSALREKGFKAVVDDSVQTPEIQDSKVLAELFPTTWGQKFLKFIPSKESAAGGATKPPMRVGVVLSGGQAAGGHNVIAGLYDSIKGINSQSQLIGFLNGPAGIFKHKYKEITEELMAQYRNMGGFDMICSGRDKIESEDQKRASMEVCQKLDLHGLVIIGGDDSNTNGAILAEYFKAKNCATKVIGVPKTIDGDLKNDYIETSFGFDTAVKTYSELIGNLCADAATSQDRYHFVRLMGRSASNITLECALQTRANLTFIGEEVEAENRSLASICDEISDMIIKRAKMGKEFGVILLPEGLIEFIPEIGKLIRELNDLLGHQSEATNNDIIMTKLTPESKAVFESLPESIRAELMLERDSHGNVQVSRIATEKLIILMVTDVLKRRGASTVCCAEQVGGADKTVTGHNCIGKDQFTFIPTGHFFGYEGRCPMPSNFDANYCYALGHTAGALIDSGMTGYMAVVRNLKRPATEWIPAGCPITIMMNIERRKGRDVPVIKKYLVELDQPMFQNFKKVREEWKYKDLYRNCGPIQFEGPSSDITNFSIDPPTANYLLPQEKPTLSKCWVAKSLNSLSPLQVERLHFRPIMSSILTNLKTRALVAKKWEAGDNAQVDRFIRRTFPLQCEQHGMRGYAVQPVDDSAVYNDDTQHRIGVVLTGQPVPGATNVILGLFERLSLIGGKLIGFKGVSGLLTGSHIIVEKSDLSLYVNQGGFEMLGRTAKTKNRLRTDDGVAAVAKVCKELELTGLVMIGGQTSLTDAAVLSEHFLAQSIPTRVIGVPANQENNVQHPLLETAIGFDTTARTYASLIGNLLTDAASATKYWYFVRLMGNVPSHITLEVALETHSNFTIVSEKYVAENMSLRDVVRDIADVVVNRASMGKNFGSVLVPEGVVSSLPQMKALLTEIDKLLVQSIDNPEALVEIRDTIVNLKTKTNTYKQLTPWSAALLSTLPLFFREQLVRQTPSGRLELSEIAAEQLIAEWVGHELEERRVLGAYNGSFNPICHYFGFQGRSAMPTNFDCALATAHGYLASILVESNLTGFVTSVRGLCSHSSEWRFSAVPIAILLRILPESETSAYGRKVPMVPCADVDMKGAAYKAFVAAAELWETGDLYCNPGPIQFAGVGADSFNRTLYEEQHEYMVMLEQLEQLLSLVGGVCSFGVNKSTLKTAVTSLGALAAILADKNTN